MVQHQRVSVRICEEGHMADARVDCRPVEAHTTLLERLARGSHIIDMQSHVVTLGVVLEAHRLGVHHVKCQVPRLELRKVLLGKEDRPVKTECLAIELGARGEVVCRHGDEVHAGDEGLRSDLRHGHEYAESA